MKPTVINCRWQVRGKLGHVVQFATFWISSISSSFHVEKITHYSRTFLAHRHQRSIETVSVYDITLKNATLRTNQSDKLFKNIMILRHSLSIFFALSLWFINDFFISFNRWCSSRKDEISGWCRILHRGKTCRGKQGIRINNKGIFFFDDPGAKQFLAWMRD